MLQTIVPIDDTVCSIRALVRDDVPMVSMLAARIWRKHYVPDIASAEQIEYMIPHVCSEAAILKYMEEKKQRSWLAFSGNTLMGYITVEPRAQGECFIDKLYVDTAIHRQGTGTLLLRHATDTLQPKRFSLRVNRRNYQAINFYFRQGFVISGLDALDIGGGYVMDDFLMHKTL